MRAVIQRVTEAQVKVDGEVTGAIQSGLVVLLGVAAGDTEKDADYVLDRVTGLRIFPDKFGKMNRNILEAGGALLIVSQFTLYADCRRGRRPSFDSAAPREQAAALYGYFVDRARNSPVPAATGVFQAHMDVHLINDGPVTIILDSKPE
jgi:D-aminoacyl-tRNA deacylase